METAGSAGNKRITGADQNSRLGSYKNTKFHSQNH